MADLGVQLVASVLTLAGMWLYGNRSLWGPLLGLGAQVPWWLIMYQGGLWGLLPLNIMVFVIHGRNLIKWRVDAHH